MLSQMKKYKAYVIENSPMITTMNDDELFTFFLLFLYHLWFNLDGQIICSLEVWSKIK